VRFHSQPDPPLEGRPPLGWIAAVLRCVGFVLGVILCFVALGVVLHSVGVTLHTEGPEEGPKTLLNSLALCAIVFGITLSFARLDHRSVLAYGLADSQALRRTVVGFATGLCLFALLAGIMVSLGALHFQGRPPDAWSAVLWGFFWLGSYGAVALAEEMLFRGYLLSIIASTFGFPAAGVVTSLLFGLAHLSNGMESPVAAINGMLLGFVLAWSVARSGSLWWAIGLHASWDWAESFLAGAADSGVRAVGRLATALPQGVALWSGGPAGPEGSIAMLLPVCVAAATCALSFGRHDPDVEPSRGAA
jgi:membrane protease YdiL (CAAX protease family)